VHAGRDRALILHGGGSAGNAWEIGVAAGLLDAGVDVTDADLIVGTSAGATAAAQLTSASPTKLVAAVLSQPAPERTGAAPGARRGSAATTDLLERTGRIIAAATDAADMRRRMGAAAIELDDALGESRSERWRATVAIRLPSPRWPDQPVLITAVDARTGGPVAFSRDSGVALVDAVAASTSGGPAYRIGEARYIDGGYRRNENADLASGYARVLIVSPFGGRSRHPPEWGMQLSAQVDELRAGGSRVETVFPDENALTAFGDDMMSPTSRPPAARAGFEHGRALAARLTGFWR
jgi:NTE family protein